MAMHLQYSTTTVILTGAGVREVSLNSSADNIDERKTEAGGPVARYRTAPARKQRRIASHLVYEDKRNELKALWDLVKGPGVSFTYRDKFDADHTVKWIDKAFPLRKIGVNNYEGVIMLEDV